MATNMTQETFSRLLWITQCKCCQPFHRDQYLDRVAECEWNENCPLWHLRIVQNNCLFRDMSVVIFVNINLKMIRAPQTKLYPPPLNCIGEKFSSKNTHSRPSRSYNHPGVPQTITIICRYTQQIWFHRLLWLWLRTSENKDIDILKPLLWFLTSVPSSVPLRQ